MDAIFTSFGFAIRALAIGATYVPAAVISAVPYTVTALAWIALGSALMYAAPITRLIHFFFDDRHVVYLLDLMAWFLTSYLGATFQFVWLMSTSGEPGLMLDETTQMSWSVKLMTSFIASATASGLVFGLLGLLIGCLLAYSGKVALDGEGQRSEAQELLEKQV
ncbi:hypothetical protein LTR56_021773 [Elasticomyces elasticus]|nr:hypothetical protein LTR56_021773 [Elasticomyces elasticus]KAK3630529.1 hypothetical protein LTR22_021445 [Elasticomyces elasticus]